MSKVILDIETVGNDFELLDEKSQEYLLKFAETEEEKEEAKQKMALYPLVSQVVTIGMLNPDTNKGVCYFQSPQLAADEFEEGGILYKPASTEKEILVNFWSNIVKYDQFITFNGRGFDCPYLMIRSAIVGLKCGKNLMPYRYGTEQHIDLLEQLTFYGAYRKFSLDFYCKGFGIKSPKENGIDGLMINGLFKEKKYVEIAKYCVGDLRATKELYERWEGYIVTSSK